MAVFEFHATSEQLSELFSIDIKQFSDFRLVKAAGDFDFDEFLLVKITNNKFEAHFHGGYGVSRALRQQLNKRGWQEFNCELPLVSSLCSPLALRLLSGAESSSISKEWRQRLLHPPRIALLGPSNAGKSTLFNAWVNEARVTVSDHLGTTRDFVEAPIYFGTGDKAIAVRLLDSAGIWDSADNENDVAAIEMSMNLIDAVDECIWILDYASPLTKSLAALITERINCHNDVLCLNRCGMPKKIELCPQLQEAAIVLDMQSAQQRCAAIEKALFEKWGAVAGEQLS